jgi:hypothetical protein
MVKEWASKITRGWSAQGGVLKTLYLASSLMGVAFPGSSAGSTLPLAAGNEWVYAYTDSVYSTQSGGGEGWFGGSLRDTTNKGTLTMTVGAVAMHSDSAFFSIAYSDTGTQTAGYHWSVMSQTGDSVTYSKYNKNFIKEYVVAKDTIFSKDGSGFWQVDNDSKLSYTSQKDSIVSDSIPLHKYSRITTAFADVAGADTIKGFQKVIVSTLWMGFQSSSNYDTIRWADKIGLLNSSSNQYSSTDFIESSSSVGYYSHFSLVRFNNTYSSIGVRMSHSSTAITTANNRRPMCRKNVVLGYPALRPSGSEVYNLNGQKVKNHAGRQLLIIAH